MQDEMEGWTIAVARDRQSDDITPYMVRVRNHPPEGIVPESFPFLLEVTWAFMSVRAGQPDEDEEERMDDFETLVEDGVSSMGEAALMATVTGKGKRVWMWYVRDVETAERLFNEALTDHDKVPIDINILVDGKWSHYEKIRNSALQAL